jgi:hypothetical protein
VNLAGNLKRTVIVALIIPSLAVPTYAGGLKSNLCFGLLALASSYYVVPDTLKLVQRAPLIPSAPISIASDQLRSDWTLVTSLASQIQDTMTFSDSGYMAKVIHSDRTFYVLKSDLNRAVTLIEQKAADFPLQLMYTLGSFYHTATENDYDQPRYLTQKEIAVRTSVRLGEVLTVALILAAVIKSGKSLKSYYRKLKEKRERERELLALRKTKYGGSSSLRSKDETTPSKNSEINEGERRRLEEERRKSDEEERRRRSSDDDDDRRRREQALIVAANSGDDDGSGHRSSWHQSSQTINDNNTITINGFESGGGTNADSDLND